MTADRLKLVICIVLWCVIGGIYACPKAIEDAAEDIISDLLTPSATATVQAATATSTAPPVDTETATHTATPTHTRVATAAPPSATATPTVALSSPTPRPDTPTPAPITATPTPAGDSGPEITWLYSSGNAKVGQWTVTSPLRVEFRAGNICLRYTKNRVWPARTSNGVEVNANPWVIGRVGAKWYGATWEWFRPGQECKPAWKVEGAHVKQPRYVPLDWRPRPGDRLGFMVSCLARTREMRNCNERTEIVWVTWPAASSGAMPHAALSWP